MKCTEIMVISGWLDLKIKVLVIENNHWQRKDGVVGRWARAFVSLLKKHVPMDFLIVILLEVNTHDIQQNYVLSLWKYPKRSCRGYAKSSVSFICALFFLFLYSAFETRLVNCICCILMVAFYFMVHPFLWKSFLVVAYFMMLDMASIGII